MSHSKKVLVTGHTGFKGTWLTLLLQRLDYEVVGYSLAPSEESLYQRMNRHGKIQERYADIRNFSDLSRFMKETRPDYVLHLAAQPLVRYSYLHPRETFEVNCHGTINLLDSIQYVDSVEKIGIVTTDKVYSNDNSGERFSENSPLSGKDPYSASKVAAEAGIRAWQTIFNHTGDTKLVSLRAGNVIGGGDYAQDRLLPDLIRSFAKEAEVNLRYPSSTRPWQHVLDPLKGYVDVLENNSPSLSSAYNFAPDGDSLSVREVTEIAVNSWGYKGSIRVSTSDENFVEAQSLQLDSSLARNSLNWSPKWSQEEAVKSTIVWWKEVISGYKSPAQACDDDLDVLLLGEPHV